MGSLRAVATDEDLMGGFFSRILFCAPDYLFALPALQPGDPSVSQELLETLRRWRSIEPTVANFDEDALERCLEYGYTIAPFTRGERVDITEPEDSVAAIGYIRYPTMVQKVAILIAASECCTEGTMAVSLRHVVLAIALVENLRQQALRVLRFLERRDPLVADAEKLLAKIHRHPGRDRSYYQRLMRWPARRFNLSVAELENSKQVSWEDQPSTGGRKSRIYFSKK